MIFGGNWNETSNSGSRCSNWNNSPTNSNNNIGVRAVCDEVIDYLIHYPTSTELGVGQIIWSAFSSRFGEHITGSENGRVRIFESPVSSHG